MLPFPAPLLLLLPAGSVCVPPTCAQVTYHAWGDDCHVHHVQLPAKCEHGHWYNTDPTYTVMFLHGSNSHGAPGLEIAAGIRTYILGRGRCLDNRE